MPVAESNPQIAQYRNPKSDGGGRVGARADESLQGFLEPSEGPRGGQRGFRSAPGRGIRPARSERLRQIHDGEVDSGPVVSDQGAHRGLWPFAAARADEIAHRLSAGGIVSLSLPQLARNAGLFRESFSTAQGRTQQSHGTTARNGRPGQGPDARGGRIFQGHATPHRPGPGADQRSRTW